MLKANKYSFTVTHGLQTTVVHMPCCMQVFLNASMQKFKGQFQLTLQHCMLPRSMHFEKLAQLPVFAICMKNWSGSNHNDNATGPTIT